jgi:hypothetical protein
VTILCIGSAADKTFGYVTRIFAGLGIEPSIVDLAALARGGEICLEPGGTGELELGGRRFRIDETTPIFLRLIDIAPAAPTAELGLVARSHFQALFRVLGSRRRGIVNSPGSDASNCCKLAHQHRLSLLTGLRGPASLLSSNPDDVRRFVDEFGGNVIYKGASATKTIVSAWVKGDFERLDCLRSVPVLFQQRIIGPDVRVHVVNERVFAEMIRSDSVDYRFHRRSPLSYEAVHLPPEIEKACVSICRASGAVFMGIDFKVDARTDEWFVLEANAMPCYQGYDRRAGFTITAAIAEYLMCGIAGRSNDLGERSRVYAAS